MGRQPKPEYNGADVANKAMHRIADDKTFDPIFRQIADRAMEKVMDALADKVSEAVAQKLPPELVDTIAEGIANKITSTTSDDNVINVSDKAVNKAEPKAQNETTGITSRPPPACHGSGSAGSKRQSSDPEEGPPCKKSRTVSEPEPRRNPRRKAGEANDKEAGETIDLPENLLAEALKPLSAEDIPKWDGWAELESEPAFFNAILKELGVKEVTAKELVSVEPWALNLLPKPVYGLIFLFQYAPHLDDDNENAEDGDEAPIWFANQAPLAKTTNNSCASVALLNIVMNANQVELGERLQDFKESTRGLSTPLRGHRIGINGFIRAAHNSFVRRMDQLNADLCLANEVEAARSGGARKRSAPKKGKRRRSSASKEAGRKRKGNKNSSDMDFAFHFIAYVPADGFVWELDGMRTRPRKIGKDEMTRLADSMLELTPDQGPVDSDDWTSVAGPRIQQRIQEYGDQENGFSLLALCRSPLAFYRSTIASHAAAVRRLHSQMQGDAAFAELVAAEERVVGMNNEAELREFGLEGSDMAASRLPVFASEQISRSDFSTGQAYSLYQELLNGARAAIDKYREGILAVAEDEERVRGRKKDYMPALHCWVTKLAEKGVLEDVIKACQ